MNKNFTMSPAKRGTRLDLFTEDIRKVAIKLRLLGDVIKSGDLRPKINTNISLNQAELKAANIESNPETGNELIELSNKFLLQAVRLANKGINLKQAFYGNTLLSTIKEFEPPASTEDTQSILQLAKNLLEENTEPVNPKTIEMTTTYLANQNNGGLAAIYLAIAAQRKRIKFTPQSWGFIITRTKNIPLEGTLKAEWSHIATIK